MSCALFVHPPFGHDVVGAPAPWGPPPLPPRGPGGRGEERDRLDGDTSWEEENKKWKQSPNIINWRILGHHFVRQSGLHGSSGPSSAAFSGCLCVSSIVWKLCSNNKSRQNYIYLYIHVFFKICHFCKKGIVTQPIKLWATRCTALFPACQTCIR